MSLPPIPATGFRGIRNFRIAQVFGLTAAILPQIAALAEEHNLGYADAKNLCEAIGQRNPALVSPRVVSLVNDLYRRLPPERRRQFRETLAGIAVILQGAEA